MIEQPSSIAWSEEYSDEDEMIDFVAAARSVSMTLRHLATLI